VSDADELKAQALAAAEAGRARRCHELFEQAHEADPGRVDLLYRLALARLEQAQVDAGVEALQAALDSDPERKLLKPEFLDPVEDLLSRRPTFKNLVKLRRQLAEGKPIKLRAREPRSPEPPPPKA